MSKLPVKIFQAVAEEYQKGFGLRFKPVDASGRVLLPRSVTSIDSQSVMIQAREHALREGVRWGQPYVFFLAPGILSWMIPLEADGSASISGLSGGEVLLSDVGDDDLESIQHFVSSKVSLTTAERYVRQLPVWKESRIQEAADFLFDRVYELSGWRAPTLTRNREQHLQQRQIAEEIHRRKSTGRQQFRFDDEQRLISLIRAGDQKGARSVLNQMLGAIFVAQPDLVIIRAQSIELMGYLVRAAIENSSHLEPLLQRNHEWMARIIEVQSFEELSSVLKDALDDFMNNIFRMGYNPSSAAVRDSLAYLGDHYATAVSLGDVADFVGLSRFRLAHLLKEKTGLTLLQHLHRLRIQEAKRLLEGSNDSCTDVAYAVGFTDQSYFIRKFKALTGITPARYRRMHQTQSKVLSPGSR